LLYHHLAVRFLIDVKPTWLIKLQLKLIKVFEDSLLTDDKIETNTQKYQDEYFIGMNARKEHIIANIDVKRTDKLNALHNAFLHNSIVIVHGASGQGKSSLAYRYLHDYCVMPYEVIDYNSSNVNDIISALIKLANQNINLQIPIYIDVLPGQKEWISIVKKLYPYADNFKLLITLREEEWNTAQINVYEFRFAEIPLSFDKIEANLVYTNFEKTNAINKFPSFDDAWRQFGESGPLLEFVFLLAQGDTLRSRLANQVKQYTDRAENRLDCWFNFYNEIKHIQDAILNINAFWHCVNYLAQLSSVVEIMPENESDGIGVIKEKIIEKSLSPLLQNIFNGLKTILEILNLSNQSEENQQLYYLAGLKNLTNLRDKLLPSSTSPDNEIINLSISLGEVKEWSKKLNPEVTGITQALTSLAAIILASREEDKIVQLN
jgi:hypothetical protein